MTDALSTYRAKLRTAVEEAIDLGLFYKREINEHVLGQVGSIDPAAEVLLETIVRKEGASFEENQSKMDSARVKLATAPRGSWIVIHQDFGQFGHYQALIGDGGAVATGGSFDTYDQLPRWQDVHLRMAEYEVNQMHTEITLERQRVASLAAIATCQLDVGKQFKGLEINRVNYSTVTVTAVDGSNGMLTISCVRRGSRRPATFAIPAVDFARKADISVEPAPAPLPRVR